MVPALAADKPNVVLIVIDDLGQRDLGCYGSTFYKTPNIDQMAKEGLRFTDFYAACPVCSPTRASIMTGTLPAADAHHRLDSRPQGHARPAPEAARDPQRTAAGGSDHRGGAQEAAATRPRSSASGTSAARASSPRSRASTSTSRGDETGTPRSYFAPFENKLGKMPGLEKAEEGEYLTDRLALEAEKFIEANKDKPFFLYLPHYAVHTPLRAKQAIIDKYKVTPKAGTQSNPVYAAMVESMDEAVGRVLKKLDDLKLSDNTLVIFTSDNGGLATTEGGPDRRDVQRPAARGEGLPLRGRRSRRVHHEVARRGSSRAR